jgi:hypothetical protein
VSQHSRQAGNHNKSDKASHSAKAERSKVAELTFCNVKVVPPLKPNASNIIIYRQKSLYSKRILTSRAVLIVFGKAQRHEKPYNVKQANEVMIYS